MTKNFQILADYTHPEIQKKAHDLTQNKLDIREQIQSIFNFVRDEIKFGFPKEGDWVSASETLKLKLGQCNTKSTLFLALCKASNIPARIHYSLIKREIQHGVFPEFLYIFLPKEISHSWIEVQIDNTWLRIDGYIDDLIYFRGAVDKLAQRGWDIGFAVACPPQEHTSKPNFEQKNFQQMCAVTEDHGVWDEPSEYYQSTLYRNRPSIVKQFLYRLFIHLVNTRIEKIRNNSLN
ncbi:MULTISPECIES: transglutaminase-like domain-containing protein [Legionella]|uniref:transglutaminase-like domain-containing protein n=1 Tax=Legionella TaxID=445 RepID=UPI00095F1ED4|nr:MULTISPECIES: transglutaminase-like domain-containing protein [Legionella]MBN9228530.1 transglutaminase domain-containing protein [Legionella steelei]OJW08829.1 MAG: hypothetical protein BGO44_10925 [Legionella sp. 39-23]